MSNSHKYIPALHFQWLTPLYDPLLRWGMREEKYKRHLIELANIQPGQRILDLGCGTGTLTILINQLHPDTDVIGLDGDPEILKIARAKATNAGVEIKLDHGMAFQLPYPDGTFDRILTSLVMHHLVRADKELTFSEVYRVLRTYGELHVVDFGKPHSLYGKMVSPIIKRMEQADDNVKGFLPIMMRSAGFDQVEQLSSYLTIFGSLSHYKGRKST